MKLNWLYQSMKEAGRGVLSSSLICELFPESHCMLDTVLIFSGHKKAESSRDQFERWCKINDIKIQYQLETGNYIFEADGTTIAY